MRDSLTLGSENWVTLPKRDSNCLSFISATNNHKTSNNSLAAHRALGPIKERRYPDVYTGGEGMSDQATAGRNEKQQMKNRPHCRGTGGVDPHPLPSLFGLFRPPEKATFVVEGSPQANERGG